MDNLRTEDFTIVISPETTEDGTKMVRYNVLIPVLIQAVKELSAKVTTLEGS